MKKLILISTILFINVSIKAQEFSYGVLLGTDLYVPWNTYLDYGFTSGGPVTFNYGGYVEYNFNKKLGIKTEVGFNSKTIKTFKNEEKFNMSFFEIAPSLKLDFGQEYRKGFYLLLGPKFSTITSATYEGEDATDLFKKSTTALQFGLGTRVRKIVDVEFKLDSDLTPFFETVQNRKSYFANFYFTIGVDLERLINNK